MVGIAKIKSGRILFLSVLFLAIISCQNDDSDEFFEESPTARITERGNELRTLLKSSQNGWRTVYFTDSTQLGGFTFLFKFVDDNNVEMTSDFDDDTSLVTSRYDVLLGATTKLSFTTKNDIHKLSDNGNPPDAALFGRGYLGDFEFLYYGIDEETGDLIFRTNRTQTELRFTRAGDTEQELAAFNNRLSIANEFTSTSKSVYQGLTINESDGATDVFDIRLNSARRFAVASNAVESFSFGFAYTANGIRISPPLEVGTTTISDFEYDAVNDEFIADIEGGGTAVLAFNNAPLFPTDDNLEVVANGNRFGYIDTNLFNTPSTSPNFRMLRNTVNENLNPFDFRLDRVQFFFSIGGDRTFNVIQYSLENINDGSIFNLNHFVTFQNIDGKLILTDDGWSDPSLIPFVEVIDDVLTDPMGLYVKEESFRVQFSNTIFTFTSAENPSIRLTTYAFQ